MEIKCQYLQSMSLSTTSDLDFLHSGIALPSKAILMSTHWLALFLSLWADMESREVSMSFYHCMQEWRTGAWEKRKPEIYKRCRKPPHLAHQLGTSSLENSFTHNISQALSTLLFTSICKHPFKKS